MDLLDTKVPAGAACRPNISARGRRERTAIAWLGVVATVAAFAATIAAATPWTTRLLVGLPAAGTAITALQVRRVTCVARAAEGTFEHDDRSRTKVSDEDAEASRRVARTIVRDGLLVGVVVAVLAAASAAVG
jgi:hypothetical protein